MNYAQLVSATSTAIVDYLLMVIEPSSLSAFPPTPITVTGCATPRACLETFASVFGALTWTPGTALRRGAAGWPGHSRSDTK